MDSNNPEENDGMHADFDNQTSYKHPRAWRNAKREMERMANGLPDLVKQLEAIARADGMCIRLALRAAIFGYVSQDKDSRMEDWTQSYHTGESDKAKPANVKANKKSRDDDDEGRAHRFAEPWAPGETSHISGLLQKQGDENRGHQSQ